MKVHVLEIDVPAMSSVGYGRGWAEGECGARFSVSFVGDHRPMREIAAALESGEEVVTDVPVFAIGAVREEAL